MWYWSNTQPVFGNSLFFFDGTFPAFSQFSERLTVRYIFDDRRIIVPALP